MTLFVRDRRHVELTSAGRTLLPDAREMLSLATNAQRRLAGTTGTLRLGYVNWLPDQLVASVRADVRIDEWVMPSHIQIARVLDSELDAASLAPTTTAPRSLHSATTLTRAAGLHVLSPATRGFLLRIRAAKQIRAWAAS